MVPSQRIIPLHSSSLLVTNISDWVRPSTNHVVKVLRTGKGGRIRTFMNSFGDCNTSRLYDSPIQTVQCLWLHKYQKPTVLLDRAVANRKYKQHLYSINLLAQVVLYEIYAVYVFVICPKEAWRRAQHSKLIPNGTHRLAGGFQTFWIHPPYIRLLFHGETARTI